MSLMNETKRTPVIAVTMLGKGMVLECSNGERLEVEVGALSREVLDYAVLHGIKQKLIDAAAIARNPDTGRSATPEDKFNAIKAVYARLMAGNWNAPRGEGGSGTGGLLFRALCKMYPAKTPEALREFLASKTASEQAALRKNPKVAAIIDELRAATAGSDGEELLSELE